MEQKGVNCSTEGEGKAEEGNEEEVILKTSKNVITQKHTTTEAS